MARLVHCIKLGKEAPGLAYPPMQGEIGKRIYQSISQEAWKLWLGHVTMVINENRLNPSQSQAQALLFKEMEKFLFAGGATKPKGYVAPDAQADGQGDAG